MAGQAKRARRCGPAWPRWRPATAYLIALLAAEKQALIIALARGRHCRRRLRAAWFGWLDRVSRSFAEHEDALGGFAVVAALVRRGLSSTRTISCCCWSSPCCSTPWRRSG